MELLQYKLFKDINLGDSFFDNLKADYTEFEDWFEKKNQVNESAYVFEDNSKIVGFLYLKEEVGPVNDIEPIINDKNVLKIGTMKIVAHGTKMGERFIKKIVDHAIKMKLDKIYVTVFKKHESLIELYKKYGFYEYGKKVTGNGEEIVLLKDLALVKDSILENYPKVKIDNTSKYVLSIYPRFHTNLFPDSKLNNEGYDLIKDISYTNSIHKIYVSYMGGIEKLKNGDILLMRRTTDIPRMARYRSVITSICVVEEVKSKYDFKNFEEFYKYSNRYSVFNENDLKKCYNEDGCYVIKMTYNVALNKRITNQVLTDEVGLNPSYWGFFKITDEEFNEIIEKGEVDESFIIDKTRICGENI